MNFWLFFVLVAKEKGGSSGMMDCHFFGCFLKEDQGSVYIYICVYNITRVSMEVSK